MVKLHNNAEADYSPSATCLTIYSEALRAPLIKFDPSKIGHYMQKLSWNKAADEKGLVAKHLFLAGDTIKEYLATLFDRFVRMQYVPNVLQTWVIIPIYKKKVGHQLMIASAMEEYISPRS